MKKKKKAKWGLVELGTELREGDEFYSKQHKDWHKTVCVGMLAQTLYRRKLK